MAKKILVKEKIPGQARQLDFEGSVEELIKKLNDMFLDAVSLGYSNVRIEDTYEGYGGDGSYTTSYYLVGERPETKKETAERIQHITEIAKANADRERAEYERLKKKFEDQR